MADQNRIEPMKVADPKTQQVLHVQNVALATATALQKPAPFTKRMLKVIHSRDVHFVYFPKMNRP